MSTNYTGNPSATESPSPAPAPGVIPVVSLPSDGDAASAASVAQAMKTPADFIGHVQTAVRLDTAVVPASGSGFSAVGYSSFGGTVTPSGSVKTNTGTRFVIQIQTGGAVGTATFKTSTDGGNTYGALQTTAASMTDATSGITLAFAGTMTANGTASFRSANTPLAQWQDVAGNNRLLVDPFGMPSGRFNRWDEDWATEIASTYNTDQSPMTKTPRWTFLAGNSAGSNQIALISPSSTYGGRAWTMTPGTNANDSVLLGLTGGAALNPQSFIDASVEFDFQMSAAGANNVAFAMGWWSGSVSAGAIPTSSNSGAYFRKQSSETNWQLCTCNGSTLTVVDSGVAPSAATWQRFRIEYHGSGTGTGLRVVFSINDTDLYSATATTPPATSTQHGLFFYGVRQAANSTTGLLGVTRWINNLF